MRTLEQIIKEESSVQVDNLKKMIKDGFMGYFLQYTPTRYLHLDEADAALVYELPVGYFYMTKDDSFYLSEKTEFCNGLYNKIKSIPKKRWIDILPTKKYANHYAYTDINPYEVIKVISGRTIEVRRMATKILNKKELIFHPGGFIGHYSNQGDQKWKITPDENGEIIRIRFGKHGWKDKHGRLFKLSDKPIMFYDFNF